MKRHGCVFPQDGARRPASSTFSIFAFSTGVAFHFLMLLRFKMAAVTSILLFSFSIEVFTGDLLDAAFSLIIQSAVIIEKKAP
jgi:hypothetical protein